MDQSELGTQSGVQKGGYRVTAHAVLRLRGTDALDYLHRMSTNELLTLAPGSVRTTVFTNEKGRIVDLADVLHLGTFLLLVASERDSRPLVEWLNRFIFMEDITVDDLSGTVQVIDYLQPPGGLDISSIHRFLDEEGRSVTRYVPPLWEGSVVRNILLTPPALPDAPDHAAETMPPLPDLQGHQAIRDEHFERWRIERGVAAFGKELTDAYNPLEARLERFVSFTKGCYIGQEVIARIDSYKKLQRHLTKFMIEGTVAPPDHQPQSILAGNHQAGVITSWASSAAGEGHVALGYLDVGFEKEALTVSCSCGKMHEVKVLP